MRILIVIPVSLDSNRGNRVTASRWAQLIGELGHDVQLHGDSQMPDVCHDDCVVFIHATRSYDSIKRLSQIPKQQQPRTIVCMSGTDLHRDFDPTGEYSADAATRRNFQKIVEVWEAVERIVLLEPEGMKRIPERFHSKCKVILQSALPSATPESPPKDQFRICVIGHLREIKDPFRTALAARLLPEDSRVQVIHLGDALTEEQRSIATRESNENPRYQWIGAVTHEATLQQLSGCHLMVISSINEGAPSVISEALVNHVPILASRIDATVGLLGADYPGFFEVGDTQQLADLIARAETEPEFLQLFRKYAQENASRFSPEAERNAWAEIL